MNGNQPSAVRDRRYLRTGTGTSALLLSAIGLSLLLFACAKRPEVVATAQPPTAGGPSMQEPGAQKPGQPGLGSAVTEPGATSGPGAPSAGGPRGGPGGPSTGQVPGEAKPGEAGRGPSEGGAGAGGAGPSASLPPGSEAVPLPPSPPREEPVHQVAQLTPKVSPLQDIFFDFDKSEIRPDAKVSLAEDITWLKAHPQAAITIEGHCDERGTSEYNLGLGERRAKATRDYLVASAIEGKRLTTVSYGKERPFVLGHDETAWKWNRRAHFVITKE